MIITTPQYFKIMKRCQHLFQFNKEKNMIFLLLDNPKEPKIVARTDHAFFNS